MIVSPNGKSQREICGASEIRLSPVENGGKHGKHPMIFLGFKPSHPRWFNQDFTTTKTVCLTKVKT